MSDDSEIDAVSRALVIGRKVPQDNKVPSEVANQFHWKCSHDCSCLPPIQNNTVYMHQSYKTENQTRWPRGWSLFHETWHNLHKDWYFVFWLNEHNDLLAKCSGFEKVFEGRSDIQKADLARLLYLHRYGGMYADMDYLALRSHVPLLTTHAQLKKEKVLLQGRFQQVVGLEWGFARQAGHPFWTFCLNNKIARFKKDSFWMALLWSRN